MDGAPVDVVDGRTEATRRHRRAATGCLAGAAVAGVLAVSAFAMVFVVTDWGPPARGLAGPEDVRPLPAGVEVVAEVAGDGSGGCGGNGDGWHVCERRVRVRMPETSREELAQLLADHYRDAGHEMDDLLASVATDGRLFGPQSCDEPDGERLCLYLEVPEDQSGWPTGVEHIADAPDDAEVDVVAMTWAYYL